MFRKNTMVTYLLVHFQVHTERPDRNSRQEMFCKKGVLGSFAKFTGKHLCQSLFLNKDTGLSSATSLKKRLWYRCLLMNFAKFPRTPILTEHLWWLLLSWLHLLWWLSGLRITCFVCTNQYLQRTLKCHF